MLAEARKNAGVLVEPRGRQDGVSGLDGVSVDREPMVYGVGSRNSYFADLYYTSGIKWRPMDPQYRGAIQRQVEWSHQVEREIANGSKMGRDAEQQFREYYRSGPQGEVLTSAPEGMDWKRIYRECRSAGHGEMSVDAVPNAERRAVSTGGGATASAAGGGAAAFVTPMFTEKDYVPYRQYGRPFADEVTKRSLPSYGMGIYMPAIQGPAAVSVQGGVNPDGTIASNGVTETDPTQGFIVAGVVITSGEVTSSQAVLDRTGPDFEYDVVIWDQLNRNYDQEWDAYVLQVALNSAGGSAWSGNSGKFALTAATGNASGGYSGQVAQTAAYMETLQGTALSPNRQFMPPQLWRFISAWSDGQERPVVVPQSAGAFNAWAASHGDPELMPYGNTGFTLGGLPIFTDPNIPTWSTANLPQAVVLDTTQTWAYEGTRIHRVVPQTLAQNLEVIFQQFSYGAVLQRYINAVQKIFGPGMVISYTN